jgi:hypothetical protein
MVRYRQPSPSPYTHTHTMVTTKNAFRVAAMLFCILLKTWIQQGWNIFTQNFTVASISEVCATVLLLSVIKSMGVEWPQMLWRSNVIFLKTVCRLKNCSSEKAHEIYTQLPWNGSSGIGWEAVDSVHLAQDRDQRRAVVNTVMNLRVPWKAGSFLISWVTVSFSIRTLLHGVS